MIRRILILGDYKLRNIAEPFGPEEMKSSDTTTLINDMAETMLASDGIGLAAPQIGVSKRMIVIHPDGMKQMGVKEGDVATSLLTPFNSHLVLVLFNPTLAAKSGKQTVSEACLSVPGGSGDVDRAKEIAVAFLDVTGKEHVIQVSDYLAACLQHELDHLDGILYVDHLPPVRRGIIKKDVEKWVRYQKQKAKARK